MVTSPSAAVEALRNHRASSAAGDDGAIMVWYDDAGRLRAQFCRWQSTVASGEFRTKKQLREWLTGWWPAMRDASHCPASALEAQRGETGTGSTGEASDIATAEGRDAQPPPPPSLKGGK